MSLKLSVLQSAGKEYSESLRAFDQQRVHSVLLVHSHTFQCAFDSKDCNDFRALTKARLISTVRSLTC